MKHLVFTVIVAILIGPMAEAFEGASAYSLLRQQFRVANVPNIEQLQPGKTWHCSASLNAAKGLFRFVNYWQERYEFEVQMGELINKVSESAPLFYTTEISIDGDYLSVKRTSLKDSLRINEAGDLLVEVNSDSQDESIFSQAENIVKPSITHSHLTAQAYFICENPTHHEDKKWERNRGNFFTFD